MYLAESGTLSVDLRDKLEAGNKKYFIKYPPCGKPPTEPLNEDLHGPLGPIDHWLWPLWASWANRDQTVFFFGDLCPVLGLVSSLGVLRHFWILCHGWVLHHFASWQIFPGLVSLCIFPGLLCMCMVPTVGTHAQRDNHDQINYKTIQSWADMFKHVRFLRKRRFGP